MNLRVKDGALEPPFCGAAIGVGVYTLKLDILVNISEGVGIFGITGFSIVRREVLEIF